MIHRLFLLFALLWTQSATAQLRSSGNMLLAAADQNASADSADQQKRRQAMRETLRAQEVQSQAAAPRQRTPQERAELREALRRQRESASPAEH